MANESPLRKTLSFSDLNVRSEQPSAPIYRNPERDVLDDDNSVFNRSYLSRSDQYEMEPNGTTQVSRNLPERPSILTNNDETKPRQMLIRIEPFSLRSNIFFDDWIERFEVMSDTNGWSRKKRRDQLPFMLTDEAQNYVFEVLQEDRCISYETLKQKLSKRFNNNHNRVLNNKIMKDRKKLPNEPLFVYWDQKLNLIKKANKNMAMEDKFNELIEGLPGDLLSDVMKAITLRKPRSLDDLYNLINEFDQIYVSTKVLKSNGPKYVRFEEGYNPRRFPSGTNNRNNSWNNKANPRYDMSRNWENRSRNQGNNFRKDFKQEGNKASNLSVNTKPKESYSRLGPKCFECGQIGHYKNSCPKLRKSNSNTKEKN
jgi:hypothetical protein